MPGFMVFTGPLHWIGKVGVIRIEIHERSRTGSRQNVDRVGSGFDFCATAGSTFALPEGPTSWK
jgi:hypothetical protein